MQHRKHHRNNVSFQDIVKTEGLKLLKYAEGVAKAKVGLMNADQQVKVTLFMGKYHGGGSHRLPCQIWFNQSLSAWGKLRAIKRTNVCYEKPHCSG